MKVLTLDLETSPNLAHVWSLWNTNVSLSQLQVPGEVIAFAAKWLGSRKVEFRSTFHDGKDVMLERAHALLTEADILVTWNGKSFDLPHLHAEFLLAGMKPPAPLQQVDLYLVAKKHFRFPSFKLDYVSKAVGLAGKKKHTGHQLWVDCLAGDERAWRLMRAYNIQDTKLTEDLYVKLLPWIHNHPSVALLTGSEEPVCTCGGTNLQKRGFAYTASSSYQRYQCQDCGAWTRSTRRISGDSQRGVAS
jgi:hypothetical protein